MIRINLLPEKISPKSAGVLQQLILAGVVVVIVLVACIIANLQVSTEIEGVKDKSAKVDQKITELKTIIGDIDAIKKKRDELTQKIGIIDELNAKRTGPVRTMQDLSFAIPYNEEEKIKKKMWVTTMKEGEGSEFHLSGISLDNETIAQFINNLNSFDTFCEVKFMDSVLKETGNSKTYVFNLSGKFCPAAGKKADDKKSAGKKAVP